MIYPKITLLTIPCSCCHEEELIQAHDRHDEQERTEFAIAHDPPGTGFMFAWVFLFSGSLFFLDFAVPSWLGCEAPQRAGQPHTALRGTQSGATIFPDGPVLMMD